MPSSILNSDDGVISGTSGIKSTGGDDGVLLIQTNGTTAQTVDSGQRTKFPTTIGVGGATPSASGSGISFPATQSASTDANTLDDYEEGTWTPADGSGAGLTFTQNAGSYTKIGKQVTCHMAVEYPSTLSGTNAVISGLPFTSANPAAQQAFGGPVILSTLNVNYAFFISANSTNIIMHDYSGARITNGALSSKITYAVLQYQTT
jgi:hypothetical protein